MSRSRSFTLVAVGDKESRKTELLLKYTTNKKLHKDFKSAMFTNNVQDMVVDGIPYSVFFVDAQCENDYKYLRLNDYKQGDCFLLCYSTINRKSFENLIKKWCIEVRRVSQYAPIILVGTEVEERNASADCVSFKEGENLKYLMGAAAFVECSLESYEKIDNVFINAVRSLSWP